MYNFRKISAVNIVLRKFYILLYLLNEIYFIVNYLDIYIIFNVL